VPIAKSFGIDLVHFGIISVVAMEMGRLTPPFGLSVFAMRSALAGEDVRIETIFAGRRRTSGSCSRSSCC
jgi:TRAP-type C4-dicarboxylate transport system permease large subunit